MVDLQLLDYAVIILFFSLTLSIGIIVSKKSGKSTNEFFLSGRNMPWWLLGFSMVATTFSTDTPNFVTNLVRVDGVSANWEWWAFLITGLLTVFIYARLWRRSEVTTDIEFYELRYGGKPARFLRGFRALYLGLIFNVLAMSGVTLAAIKIGQIMLGLSPLQTIGIAGVITVFFSVIGGFRGVVYTDFVLFFVAIGGAVGAAYYTVNLPEVGGLSQLISNDNVVDKLSLLPDLENPKAVISLLVIPLAVQWWSSWFPGAEPGGGGYIAQRMLAAKNENHAIGATFFFNVMHYALRPWPWILVALASLVVFPDLQSIKDAFPGISTDKLGHDLAYSAMLTKLPSGLLGLLLASLGAAYISTISTHLNWGSSYIVNDFYKQHIKPKASEKELVRIGRLATVALMVLSALLALLLTHALQIFKFIIMFGAGTGLIFLLRWFWWRINAWSEISAMFSSGVVSIAFHLETIDHFLFTHTQPDHLMEIKGIFPEWAKTPLVVLITTIIWLLVTFLTKPEDTEVLKRFYIKIRPEGKGWKPIVSEIDITTTNHENRNNDSIPKSIIRVLTGCCFVYGALFSTGYWIYRDYYLAAFGSLITSIAGILLFCMSMTKKS